MTIRVHLAGCALLTVAALAMGSAAAAAQSQITVVVSVAAGGSSDIGLRTIAAKVEQMGGPKIVIEARPGGGGVTATLGVKDAPPDGRTLLLASYATFVVNPAMGTTQYDPIADFQPITTLFSFPVMLAVPRRGRSQVGGGARSRSPSRSPAACPMPRRASARPAICSASCSRRAPARRWSTFPTRAQRRR